MELRRTTVPGVANPPDRRTVGTSRTNTPRNTGEPSGSTEPTEAPDTLVPNNANTYRCRFPDCEREFATIRGRGVHEQKAHKNWHDDQQCTIADHKKAPWTDEEMTILARHEAQLIMQDTKFINQALLPIFQHRSLEAIKGQRRKKEHKEKVAQMLRELQDPNAPNEELNSNENPQIEPMPDIKSAVSDLFAQLDPLKGTDFNANMLKTICTNVKQWSSDRIFEELEIYLLKTFPPTSATQHAKTTRTPQTMTKRQSRRVEYAKTQRAWRKNPCKCLKTLLKSKYPTNPPSKRDMVEYWRTVMTRDVDTSPPLEQKRLVRHTIWDIITPEEIKASFPSVSTCPGPDGLTTRQLRAVPLQVITRILNLILVCGKMPRHLLRAKTTLIPKKDGNLQPGDYRPITVQSTLTRLFHKILAKRITNCIEIDDRQKAFLPKDGCAENIFNLDLIFKHHRQHFKPLYLASFDIAKAFDSVSHKTISETLNIMGLPDPMISYILSTYQRSTTYLSSDDWRSDDFRPTCGVKQGDPLSPILFNLIIDRLLRKIPPEIGVDVGGNHFNAFAFADDIIFVASTPLGLQRTIDTTSEYLMHCGLSINTAKSFTVAIRNVPHMKKSIVDGKCKFTCLGRTLPALKREDEWKYLGVPFTPEGCTAVQPESRLKEALDTLTKAPLKPQQRLFGLRTVVLPSLYHLLTLGNTTLSRLKRIDTMTRAAVRKWLDLPHDVVNAYIHTNVKDGGLSIPSMRWLMPLQRRNRLERLHKLGQKDNTYLSHEIQIATRRLTTDGQDLRALGLIEARWAHILHTSNDGKALKESSKVPQQHQWVIEGTRFLSGRDYLNAIKMRINALPTRSRTKRGRIGDRSCRAGCNAAETLNHISQQCHRSHKDRIERHDAIVAYIKRSLSTKHDLVEAEPRLITAEGLLKPDLVAVKGSAAIVIDAQVVGENQDLEYAHQEKIRKYRVAANTIKEKYKVKDIFYTSAVLSSRGIWCNQSANELAQRGILKKSEFKIISTRVIIGGLNIFWKFNQTTTVRRRPPARAGIG